MKSVDFCMNCICILLKLYTNIASTNYHNPPSSQQHERVCETLSQQTMSGSSNMFNRFIRVLCLNYIRQREPMQNFAERKLPSCESFNG